MSFKGKVAVVTGGGSGIGRTFATRMAEKDANVVLMDVNQAGMQETKAGFDNVHTYLCDVRDHETVSDILMEIETKFGPIDRVVSAAGVMPSNPIIDDSRENILRVMDINYAGTVNILMASLPKMVKRGSGDFIAMGSITGIIPSPQFGAYSASKAAINMLLETAYYENRGTGVRIFFAAPQAVETPLLDQSLNNPGVQRLRKNGFAMPPEKLVDVIERSIDKGHFTTNGNFLGALGVFVRRFSPGLMWRILFKMNEKRS